MEYIRPELTKAEVQKTYDDARNLVRKYGIYNIGTIIVNIMQENRKLLKEVNEHRAARGIDPLPVIEE